jgi:hypothetical protein
MAKAKNGMRIDQRVFLAGNDGCIGDACGWLLFWRRIDLLTQQNLNPLGAMAKWTGVRLQDAQEMPVPHSSQLASEGSACESILLNGWYHHFRDHFPLFRGDVGCASLSRDHCKHLSCAATCR